MTYMNKWLCDYATMIGEEDMKILHPGTYSYIKYCAKRLGLSFKELLVKAKGLFEHEPNATFSMV